MFLTRCGIVQNTDRKKKKKKNNHKPWTTYIFTVFGSLNLKNYYLLGITFDGLTKASSIKVFNLTHPI